jgi:hypothetical protein
MQPKSNIILLCFVMMLAACGCDSQKPTPFASIDEVLKRNSHYTEYELLETFGNAKPPFYRSSTGDVVLNEGANNKACKYTEHGASYKEDLSQYNQEIVLSFIKDSSDNTRVLVLGRKSKTNQPRSRTMACTQELDRRAWSVHLFTPRPG